jgi:phospholipid-translocating ATPase
MIDGIYQSLICFYMSYLLFAPAVFVTESGHDVGDTSRMGVYVGCGAIAVVNAYVLLNTYRWDWLMVLLVSVSILLIWFWTGVYSAFPSSNMFYKAAPEVFQQATFWAITALTVTASLLPRFVSKAFQKLYMPRDVDIVREQVRQGKFDYLEEQAEYVPPSRTFSAASSSDASHPKQPKRDPNMEDDERPIYPPSVAPTVSTHPLRSQNGSVATEYLGQRNSLEQPPVRQSIERPRPSYDRMRCSMDRIRPSFEASNDFTSASLLSRMESSHCRYQSKRTNDITDDLR